MNDEEYQLAQSTLIMAARLLSQYDWAAFFGRIEHAETVGTFLFAPVLYREATSLTRPIGSMALLAGRLVKALGELDAAATARVARPAEGGA